MIDGERKRECFVHERINARFAAAASHPSYGPVAPRIIEDREDRIAFEKLEGYQDIEIVINADEKSSTIVLHKLGSILAFVHQWKSEMTSTTEMPSNFPLTLDNYLKLNPLVLRMLTQLKTDTHVALDHLKLQLDHEATQKCYVHGDFKPDNIMVKGTNIRLVDWELSGMAPPEHDFASFCAGTLTSAVNALVAGSEVNKTKDSKEAMSDVVELAIRTTADVIVGYTKAGQSSPDIDLLTRLIGAKLLVRAAMNFYLQAGESPFASLLLQAGENCLVHPNKLTRVFSTEILSRTDRV